MNSMISDMKCIDKLITILNMICTIIHTDDNLIISVPIIDISRIEIERISNHLQKLFENSDEFYNKIQISLNRELIFYLQIKNFYDKRVLSQIRNYVNEFLIKDYEKLHHQFRVEYKRYKVLINHGGYICNTFIWPKNKIYDVDYPKDVNETYKLHCSSIYDKFYAKQNEEIYAKYITTEKIKNQLNIGK